MNLENADREPDSPAAPDALNGALTEDLALALLKRPDLLAPPAYTTGENAQREFRYAAYDWSQAIEDIDKDVLMTRPSSRLTNWNVRESD